MQKCHFFSNSSQQKLSTPPWESFKEILEEILEGNLECGPAQPSLFHFTFMFNTEVLICMIPHCQPL